VFRAKKFDEQKCVNKCLKHWPLKLVKLEKEQYMYICIKHSYTKNELPEYVARGIVLT